MAYNNAYQPRGNNGFYPQERAYYQNNRPRVYSPQYAQNQYGPTQQAPPPKRSGAKYTEIRKGNFTGGTIVNAWNKSKSKGLITATVAPYHKSEELVESKTGNQYIKMIASVEFRKTGNKQLIPVLMNLKTKVIVLKELAMVITPNGSGHTSSGKKVTGYFGTMMKK